jgi:hypothetical protein
MNNCLTCKINEECDFGIAVNTFLECRDSDDHGLATVVELMIENIKQYINCDYYESK